MSEKKQTYLVWDEQLEGDVSTGEVGTTLAWLQSYIESMAEGEVQFFQVTRHDMTQEEMDAQPVL